MTNMIIFVSLPAPSRFMSVLSYIESNIMFLMMAIQSHHGVMNLVRVGKERVRGGVRSTADPVM